MLLPTMLIVICLVPTITLAQEPVQKFIPCDGVVEQCDFNKLMELIQNVLNYIVAISFPLAAAVFAYAGFKMMVAGDNANARTEAKKIFMKVAIGFAVILAAWLIVFTILNNLLEPGKIDVPLKP